MTQIYSWVELVIRSWNYYSFTGLRTHPFDEITIKVSRDFLFLPGFLLITHNVGGTWGHSTGFVSKHSGLRGCPWDIGAKKVPW